jgi:hypothetical protein
MKKLVWGYQLSRRSMINPQLQRMDPCTTNEKQNKTKQGKK